jgi:hypothetical protein
MTSEESKMLLRNMGFQDDFLEVFSNHEPVYTIKREKIRKVASENAVVEIPPLEETKKRSREDDDMMHDIEQEESEIFQRGETGFGADCFYSYEEELEVPPKDESRAQPDSANLNLFHACSKTQMDKLTRLVYGKKSEKEKVMVKAYKSKLKSKFYQVYEANSQQFREKIKFKIFHKCNYPSCGRTFASAGWLKSHFQEHLKELKKNKFNILFEDFLLKFNPRISNDIVNS